MALSLHTPSVSHMLSIQIWAGRSSCGLCGGDGSEPSLIHRCSQGKHDTSALSFLLRSTLCLLEELQEILSPLCASQGMRASKDSQHHGHCLSNYTMLPLWCVCNLGWAGQPSNILLRSYVRIREKSLCPVTSQHLFGTLANMRIGIQPS